MVHRRCDGAGAWVCCGLVGIMLLELRLKTLWVSGIRVKTLWVSGIRVKILWEEGMGLILNRVKTFVIVGVTV